VHYCLATSDALLLLLLLLLLVVVVVCGQVGSSPPF
jgi:hypothetical protein